MREVDTTYAYELIEYTPYGELWIEKASTASNIDIPYRFTGKERDEETGLYYYGARYLDSKASRWLSTDPALGDYIPGAPVDDEARKRNQSLPGMGGVFNTVNFHLYHYAGNNPVKYVDPDGREPKWATIGNAINLDFGRDYMNLAGENFNEGEYGVAALVENTMKYSILILVFTIIFTSCIKGDEKMKNKNAEILKDEINALVNNFNNIDTVKQYFLSKNIGFELWDKNKSEFTRIENLVSINDIVCFAIYYTEKKIFITSQYVVYIIFDNTGKTKNVVFDIFYTGI
jgi:RHS repeat-associated protein